MQFGRLPARCAADHRVTSTDGGSLSIRCTPRRPKDSSIADRFLDFLVPLREEHLIRDNDDNNLAVVGDGLANCCDGSERLTASGGKGQDSAPVVRGP